MEIFEKSLTESITNRQLDLLTMSAWADYIEENDLDENLDIGLRWCIFHKKSPITYNTSSFILYNASMASYGYDPGEEFEEMSRIPEIFMKSHYMYIFNTLPAAFIFIGKSIKEINNECRYF